LIVDDNATNCLILERQAQAWGMQATAVSSGAEAFSLLVRGHACDVAILDLQMPEMDGVVLARRIRGLPQSREVPLILLTSVSLAGALADAKDAALFCAVMAKPAKPGRLEQAIARALALGTVPPPRRERPAEFDPHLATRVPLRLLVAEDNQVNQKVALKMLERLGYRADVAANGIEVLAALERQSYDVILMDVQMPEMDGLEATRCIDARWTGSRRPRIVAMTAGAMREDRDTCLAAGMDFYLAKPLAVAELAQVLEQCGQARAACSPASPRPDEDAS
jgi:CheY-like chemotaxis protein